MRFRVPVGTTSSLVRRAARRTAQSVALVAAVIAVGADEAGAAPQPHAAGVVYIVPLPLAQVLASFDVAATTYGPGHRGVDLRAGQGASVTAASDGVVTFAGLVVDRGVVVILHRDGIRTTYEPVEPRVPAGAVVQRGQLIAVIAGQHRGRDDVLHWGARRGDAYLDPMRLVRPLGAVRLTPTR